MDTKQRTFSPLSHDISLKDLVPKDSFYRRLEEGLDLSFVRDLVRPLYGEGGRPSVDPVVFFKLRKRKVWVEPPFAKAKAWHGMDRFRLRTLRRVNAEALLVAAGQNLKRLLAFERHRPERPASLTAVPHPAGTPTAVLHGLRRHRAKPRRYSIAPVLQQAGTIMR